MSDYAALLITAFNRPRQLEELLASLAQFDCKIYLSLDVAKVGDTENEKLVESCKLVIEKFSSLITELRISPSNQGCFRGVSNAISWGFTKETRLIILEDDIRVGEAFLIFASQMLQEYEFVDSIGSIAGTNYVPTEFVTNADHPFRLSAFTSSWGWATWSNRWREYETDLVNFPAMQYHYPENFWNFSRKCYWKSIFRKTKMGVYDAWDYRWLYSNWIHNRLTIVPSSNLVINVGFGRDATHTKNEVPPKWVPSTINEAYRSGTSPIEITRDLLADAWIEQNHLGISLINQVKSELSFKFPKLASAYRNYSGQKLL